MLDISGDGRKRKKPKEEVPTKTKIRAAKPVKKRKASN